ncbi:MAG: hypothetical protein V7636_630 [Actinomycetota bacterium]|jgi:enterochelin esterase-like enzyme
MIVGMSPMTRRVVLGAGAMATAGGAALAVGETERGRRWLHVVGVVRGPDLDPPDVDVAVQSHALDSDAMRRRVEWSMSVPAVAPTAVVVCLHGRGNTHAYAFDTIGVQRFVADAGLPWAVASVDGGEATYWHERADGRDPQAMIFDELLPAIRRSVGDVPVGLLGWSMGGYGALLATSDRDEVVATAAASPAIWRRFAQATLGAFDSADDFHRHDLFDRADALRRRAIRIDCGNDDPFRANAAALADAIDADAVFTSGFHDAGYWRSRVPAQLTFLAEHLPH